MEHQQKSLKTIHLIIIPKNKDLLQKETRRIEDTEKASKELSEASKKISEKLEQMKQMYNKSKTK